MEEPYEWLTVVSHYDREGFVHQDPITLWTCMRCGAVVADDMTLVHLAYHG